MSRNVYTILEGCKNIRKIKERVYNSENWKDCAKFEKTSHVKNK